MKNTFIVKLSLWLMKNHELPIYAIVELLIRMSSHQIAVGDYKNHTFKGTVVSVKTTKGTLIFSSDLIAKQFLSPNDVTISELLDAGNTFMPSDL